MEERLELAVIMGGQSAEREVSLRTGATVVREIHRRHRVRPVEILEDGRWRAHPGFVGEEASPDPGEWFTGPGVPASEAVARLVEAGLDAAFNALHGPMGEDGTVQGLFRVLGVPLTGPDVIPAAVTMDKRLTKQVMIASGVPTPRFFRVRGPELWGGAVEWPQVVEREAHRVPFPWVLKPNRLGSSVGVAFFRDPGDLVRRAQDVLESWPDSARGDDLLVEEAVTGRELTCGVIETGRLGDGEGPRALPPIEIRPRTSAFFDYHAKYTPGASEEICPAPLSREETALVQATAVAAHRLFECAPLSRTDMFLLPSGAVTVLEVNTLPGMTATSLIPLSASREGIALADLFAAIVEHAVERTANARATSYHG